jgi:hypothetical protein
MSEREPETSASSTDTSASTADTSASSTDTSASTAEFRRFAAGANADTAPPWAMRAPGKRVALLAAVVIAVAVILGIVAIIVING